MTEDVVFRRGFGREDLGVRVLFSSVFSVCAFRAALCCSRFCTICISISSFSSSLVMCRSIFFFIKCGRSS